MQMPTLFLVKELFLEELHHQERPESLLMIRIILEASDFTGLEFQMRRLRDLRDGKPVKVHRVHAFVMFRYGTPHIHVGQIPKNFLSL